MSPPATLDVPVTNEAVLSSEWELEDMPGHTALLTVGWIQLHFSFLLLEAGGCNGVV